MKVVSIKNLQKKFGNFTALHDVSFDVDKGEVFGFIGPNGAGKSTTIRILLGILKATSGNATLLDKDVWKDAVDIHRKIAYVPGEVNLWPNLTGGEVIDLFMSLQGTRNNEKRDKLIKLFDLDPSKKTRTYSKGNRQKVALIAALSSDAEVYILDEPTSGLDPLMEQVFQESILELKKAGKSILLSSHILSEVEKLCDRVAIIRDGKIVEVGTLDELRHLTRTQMMIKTKRPISDISKLKFVHDFNGTDTDFSFSVDTDRMGDIISTIAMADIVKLESALPTLEDLFMKHYDNNGRE